MRKKKGFTLIELLVVIAIIAMLLAILMPALSKVKKIAQRVICGTNLKGLGTAQTVYAQDYDDEYVVQGGGVTHNWTDSTQGWQNPDFNWAANDGSDMSVGASLYLLVREADVSPKSFVCPASDQHEYDGTTQNTANPDIVQLWDFGNNSMVPNTGPRNCVSYSYQLPYNTTGQKSRYAADGTKSAQFAVMADKNPLYDSKLRPASGATVDQNNYKEYARAMGQYYVTNSSVAKWEIEIANAQPHEREGQNVLFADGHASYEKTPDVGVKNDNIYTVWTVGTDQSAWRVGLGGVATNYGVGNTATYTAMGMSDDSMLVNDDNLSTN